MGGGGWWLIRMLAAFANCVICYLPEGLAAYIVDLILDLGGNNCCET
jgi:hypothetical protein